MSGDKAPLAQGHGPEPAPARAPYIVLVGLDLSEPGGRAWRFAFELAALKGDDSEVHAVIVGSRALAPRVRDLSTPGVLTARRFGEPAHLPPLKVLQHRGSAGGQARLMAMHFRTGAAPTARWCSSPGRSART